MGMTYKIISLSIDELEGITGMDFFKMLPKRKQDELEAKVEPEKWR